jgi:hypothetical protein
MHYKIKKRRAHTVDHQSYLVTVVSLQDCAQDAVVHVDDGLELGPEPLPEPGRALNVGEHQADVILPESKPVPAVITRSDLRQILKWYK